MRPPRPAARPAAAAVWTVLVIAIVSALAASTLVTLAGTRRRVEAYRHATQAEWLARTGHEIAAAKVRADAGYEGETATPVPGGTVTIAVRREPKGGNVYVVTCEARTPAGGKAAATRTETRSFQRVTGPGGVSIETVPEP